MLTIASPLVSADLALALGGFAIGTNEFVTILVPLLRTRLMDVAQDGQWLASALNHSTFNIANAVGAWLGRLLLAAGLGYEWPSRVGAMLAVAGVGIALLSVVLGRRTARRG